jgi:hypothetical protein
MKFEWSGPLSPNARALMEELVTVTSMATKGRTRAAKELDARGLALLSPSGRKIAASKAGIWAMKEAQKK